MKTVHHKQMIVSARVDWFFKGDQKEEFEQWLRDVISHQKMNLMAGPISAHLDRPGLEGWSGSALIETSDVAIHVWDAETPIRLEFDIYTCGELYVKEILDDLKIFGARKIHVLYLDREDGIKILGQQTFEE